MEMTKIKDHFIWSILLHLGYRMWGDDDSLKTMPDSLAFDYDVWKEATERMAEIGMNMVVVDVGTALAHGAVDARNHARQLADAAHLTHLLQLRNRKEG